MDKQEEKILIESVRKKQMKVLVYGSIVGLCLMVGLFVNLSLWQYIKYDYYHALCAGLGELVFDFLFVIISNAILALIIFSICLFMEIKLTRTRISLEMKKNAAYKHLLKYIIVSIIIGILYFVAMLIVSLIISVLIKATFFNIKYKGGCTL